METREQFAATLGAIASVPRLAILTELLSGEVHVSELARRLSMSRALLYMHLAKLEAGRFIRTRLILSPEGNALKLVALEEFDLRITPEFIGGLIEVAPSTNEGETEDA